MIRTPPLLYRAARQGIYGKCYRFERGGITDALFVFLEGEPDPAAETALETRFLSRPWVCMSASWEEYIRTGYPKAQIYRRWMMKPASLFRIPEDPPLPEGYRIAAMDEAAFRQHPFSHGKNYSSYETFRAEGAGAVAYAGGEIVASASSYLSLEGEAEMDIFTLEAHRGKGLASACAARMLQDCREKGIIVHWDAQNEISRHLAEKFGFETETEYAVYWLTDPNRAKEIAEN